MAGRIPKHFIDDLLLRIDIVEVIDARVPLKKAGKDYKACCPFHEEKTPSFTVSASKQFYHCFGCGAHGTAIGFLMEYEHMSFPEAVEELARRAGLALPKEAQEPTSRTSVSADLLRLLEESARFYRAQLRDSPRAVAYLKGRGISGETAAAFGLGYAPEGWDNLTRLLGKSAPERDALVQAGLAVRKDGGGCYDRFRDRVMFPIHDYRGRIVGFGGRVVDQGEPKYMNSPETPLFHKGQELYGLFRARDAIRKAGRVIVVEGYMDVVGLGQAGVDIAVATLGTSTTSDHLERLFRFAPDAEVIFCFDGDQAGREAAWRALEVVLPQLRERRQVSFMFLPKGEDPDTYVRRAGKDDFLAQAGNAMSVPDFLFERLTSGLDMTRSGALVRLAERARPYLDKVPPGLLRETMLDRLKLDPLLHDRLSVRRPSDARETAPGAGVGPRPAAPLIRLAIAMLIQHPELGSGIEDGASLAIPDSPGAPLLQELLGLLRGQPGLNTAAVVEHFRDSEYQHIVSRLAAWVHPALVHDVAAEFEGVLKQMKRATIRGKIENLLQKQKVSGLTPLEFKELADLTRLQRQRPEAAQH